MNFNYYTVDSHNGKYGTECIQCGGVGVGSMCKGQAGMNT